MKVEDGWFGGGIRAMLVGRKRYIDSDLHSVIGCDDGVVGVDQGAFTSCHCDGRLQAAGMRTAGGSIDWSVHASDGEGCLVHILERLVIYRKQRRIVSRWQ